MIYNTTHKFTKTFIDLPSQEDIFNMPEYFAMSRDEVVKSGCPDFLKVLLNQFPWLDRPNVLQIRPQDFRLAKPMLLGDCWHIDVNVRLKDGKIRGAKSMEDFRLLVVSFGGVVGTDFIKTPLDLPDLGLPGANYGQFFTDVGQMQFEIEQAQPNQLAEYSSKDIHRMGQKWTLGRFRLMIVAFESDEVIGDGIVLPSLREKEQPGAVYPKFEDYIA